MCKGCLLCNVLLNSGHFNQKAYCTTLLSHFTHTGKPGDGEHLCLVMNVFAGDIEPFWKESKVIPIALAKLILRDTLRGLAQLHGAGCVHTGACLSIEGVLTIDIQSRPKSCEYNV
jgi:hypothetical protein